MLVAQVTDIAKGAAASENWAVYILSVVLTAVGGFAVWFLTRILASQDKRDTAFDEMVKIQTSSSQILKTMQEDIKAGVCKALPCVGDKAEGYLETHGNTMKSMLTNQHTTNLLLEQILKK